MGTAAACSNVRLFGLGTSWSSLAHVYSAHARLHPPNTSSPGLKRVTFLPTVSTRPARSTPTTKSFFGLGNPTYIRIGNGVPRMAK